MGLLQLCPEIMRREKLLNACAALVPHFLNLRSNLPAVIKEIAAKGPRFLLRRFSPERRLNTTDENPGERLSLRKRLLERYYTERRSGWFDLHSIRRTQEIFRQKFVAAGLGTFMPTKPNVSGRPEAFSSPHHFMGTTRMHDNPRHGVVDANCRVHGLQNLFIAGSSVFPTSGFANPTLTVVALALRLAEHLGNLYLGNKLSDTENPCLQRD